MGAPVQQSIDDVHVCVDVELSTPHQHTLHPDGSHAALPEPGAQHSFSATEKDKMYSNCLCYACGVQDGAMIGPEAIGSFGFLICCRQESICGIDTNSPFVREKQECELITPNVNAIAEGCKCFSLKCGCDLGTSLKNKCKP